MTHRPIRVLKFGGTSVADMSKIRHAAALAASEAEEARVCVVVSAMGKSTDALVGLCDEATGGLGEHAAKDMVLASGEQVSAGLTALVLETAGQNAQVFAGPSTPLRTTNEPGRARITGVAVTELLRAMDSGNIAVVAGFQGLSDDGSLRTIGRGGSDATAAALAAALKAEVCDIYTDVDAVRSSDPRIVTATRALTSISYEEMLEMADLGAQVLQARAVEIAMRTGLPLRVLSATRQPGAAKEGTMVEEVVALTDDKPVSAVVVRSDLARLSILGLDAATATLSEVFDILAGAGIDVAMIVEARARQDTEANITVGVQRTHLEAARQALEAARDSVPMARIETDANTAQVAVVGFGISGRPDIARIFFQTLSARGVAVRAVSSSQMRLSALIDREYAELAARALHTAFGLDAAMDSRG